MLVEEQLHAARLRQPTDLTSGSRSASAGGDDRRKDLTRVARDGALKFGGSILSDVLGFVFVVIATRGFGRVDAGRFFEAMALAIILSNVAKLGADTGFVRFLPKYRVTGRVRDVGPVLLIGMVPVALLAVVLGVVAYFLGPELARLLSKRAPEQLVPYLRVLSAFLPVITVYAVALAASRGFGTIEPLVVDNVIVPGGRTVAALAALALGVGAVSLAFATGGAMAAGLLIVLVWTYRLLRRVERRAPAKAGDPPRTPTVPLFGEFWRFAGPRGIASIFTTLASNASILLLGALAAAGAGGVGVFAAATRFMRFGTLARIAIFYVISPQISALLARGDRERAQAVYEVSTWWVMIGSWPVYIVLAVWAPLLMKLFGRGFSAGATALTILSLAMLVSMAAGPVQVVLLMDGRAMWNLIDAAVTLGLVVVLSIALIPKYGVDGAAIAAAISIVVNNVAAFIQVSVLVKLRTTGPGFWIAAAASLLAFGAVGIAFRSVFGASIVAFAAFAVISSGLYILMLLRFGDVLELPLLWDTVARRGRRGRRGRRSGGGGGGGAGAGAGIEADLELDAEDHQGSP
jgi:O-antigen/teichoic acid export membrane protein